MLREDSDFILLYQQRVIHNPRFDRLFGPLFINLVILIILTVESTLNYSLTKALDILKRFWGYDSFRKKQDKVIESVIDGKDTLALLPTGGGKSICYQVPGLMSEGC